MIDTALLDDALTRLPRKGSLRYPVSKKWSLAENVHEWALSRGYLTGAVFKRGDSLRLLVAGRCPWDPEAVRFYTASLPNPERSSAKETT